MKKFLLSVFCLSTMGFTSTSAFINEKTVAVCIESEVSVMQGWEYCTTVTKLYGVKKTTGRMAINRSKSGKFRIEKDGDSYRIYFEDAYYTVRTSDRDGYDYMFYADGFSWHFNCSL